MTPYVPAMTPYVPAMTPYVPAMSLYVPAMTPYVPAMTPYVPAMSLYVPAMTLYVPAITPYVPAMTPYVPAMTPYVPAMTPYVPAMSLYVPAMTLYVPAMTLYVPAMTLYEQAMTQYVPAMTLYVQAMTLYVPAMTLYVPVIVPVMTLYVPVMTLYVPAMTLAMTVCTTSDEELFEDNPEEYIRRDIEGSDVDTRRRAACDLVQALCKVVEGPVIQNFSQYVQALLAEYAADPGQRWRSKDAAIYLVTSLAAKAQTQKHGITQTSELVNITDFYNSHIAPDLQKADVPMMRTMCPVKCMLTHESGEIAYLSITYTDVQTCATKLIENLLGAMNLPGSTENEYLMKAIMRSASMMQENLVPLVGVILKSLTEKLLLVAKTLCVTIRTTCKVNPVTVAEFEQALFPPFTEILQQDVQEFIPYVFQILSLLIELHTDAIPDTYMQLFPHLLVPLLWERPGNIPPLEALYLDGKSEILQPYMKQVFVLLFQRLQSSKTTKYIKSLLVFFCVYMIKYGAPALIEMIDAIQTKYNFAGYQTAYSQLAFAGRKEHDLLSETVPQLKMGLAKNLEKLGAQQPGKLMPLINTGVQPEAQKYLQEYLSATNFKLALALKEGANLVTLQQSVDGGCRDVNGTRIANQIIIDRKTFGTMDTNKPIMGMTIDRLINTMTMKITIMPRIQLNQMTLTNTNVLNNNSLRVCTWNGRGVMSSAASLSNLLLTHQIDIAFITEHKLFDHSKYFFDTIQNGYRNITICDQNFNTYNNLCCGKGGVSIMYKSNLDVSVKHINESINDRICRIKIDCRTVKIFAFCVYIETIIWFTTRTRREWVPEGQPRGWHNESYAKYKRCKQNFVTTQKIAIENVEKYFNSQLIEAAECDSRLFWSLIKSRKNKRPSACTHLFYKNISNQAIFKGYLQTIFVYSPLQCEHFDNDFKKLVEEKVEQLKVKNSTANSIPEITITINSETIKTYIKTLKKGKASSYDAIFNEHLIYGGDALHKALA
ncbi:LOW QUALITY PROTEIN: XPO2-like protein, partial [Mya arenaria]